MTEEQFRNPSDDEIREILRSARTVAVVGLSNNEDRPAHGVARALQSFGYRIVPVNPTVDSALGESAVDHIAEAGSADIVDVFRHSRHVPEIVDQTIEAGVGVLWLQEGVVDEAAALRARKAGLRVVMDRCIFKEYRRLMS